MAKLFGWKLAKPYMALPEQPARHPDVRAYSEKLLSGVRSRFGRRLLLVLGVEPPPFLLWMTERAEGQEPRIAKPFTVGGTQFSRRLFFLASHQNRLNFEASA